ncbi:MAG: DUF2946 family protein [Gammaproteobacteria bacterium]|jgi:hypothetical protein|nr:DUF2946 family protein [Gammaproteobacteria bacterium]MBT4606204.1 DUF2946 family protein [Thiotrichales bacterium]MBT3472317.1 DUF2946 family protein [Gammaproteobacteria bacterium]MBT3967864.1 DUF2946 family protein [Gammaproteobacteria bacterium]MBT4081769.1 DUF2946 family protein [Gammaproteobacteria bacterium]
MLNNLYKNRFYQLQSARVVLWVLLLQLISPAVYALVSEPEPNGYLTTYCSVQGTQMVWVEFEEEQSGSFVADIECPYCLLNLFSADSMAATSAQLLHRLEATHVVDLPSQESIHSSNYLQLLPIRAPPHAV